MLVGIPKEIKPQEYRVGLVPASVSEFVRRGHQVLVEAGCGVGIGEPNAAYRAAGALIAENAAEIFERAELIVKVKEPQPSEWAQLSEQQILFTFLHLAPDPKQAEGLCNSGCIAFAYETVEDPKGDLVLLAPMSEVAGRLSIQAAANALTKNAGGPGLLMGGVPRVQPSEVVIIGGGTVGVNAARMALGLAANVTIFDRSVERLRELDTLFEGRIKTRFSTNEALLEAVQGADAVIGAVLIPGASPPKLVSRTTLAKMKSAAVIVDVAIDQGGCFETSKPTTHDAPTFVVDDVIHYCVANMPGAVPKTSSYALNNATLDAALLIADLGWREAAKSPLLRGGLNVAEGRIVHEAVERSLYQ